MPNGNPENTKFKETRVWEILAEIPDPEIPVLTILDLGIVRKVEFHDEKPIITITPTYSGCPAMQRFEKDIVEAMEQNGFEGTEVPMIYEPAWTTDWITEKGRRKLKEYGIAPPEETTANKKALFFENDIVTVTCPRCNSKNTKLESQFGSTACKALYKCNDCLEPFEYFKCL
ncbi:MAG: phenylacetate-CoA oxygenase subunit PaaJ [Crocinitomicaceae bacterium]|nr:phenylacetate-CoA oxygenase subunit PaaJ [Crocinitomicaceae bacterium]